MKKILILTTLVLSSISFAGSGHDHSHGHGHSHEAVSKDKTKELGKKHVERLVKAGKLNASWKSATYIKSVKKKFGKRTEWVVSFKNDKGVKGKNLYIFLKLSGTFVAANFSGK